MVHDFQPGDYLIFQIESGYALLRVLDVQETSAGPVWHLAAYNDLFLDVEMADAAVANGASLSVSHPHLALTNRAFESTQVSKLGNASLGAGDLAALREWKENDGEVSDRSVRLLIGLR